MDFERIDINQCPKGEGNKGKNKFADTARCKKETTECEPLDGWGFRRGGYQCRCRPGFRLPSVVRRPFLGEILERASDEQYYNGFDCKRIGWIHKTPIDWYRLPQYTRERYLNHYYEYKNYTKGATSLHSEKVNVNEVLNFILGVTENTCNNFHAQDLVLNGDVAFGAHKQFANEAKMALRLANFISAFLQISDPLEVYSGKRVADKPLTEDQMMGETLSLVMGNSRIWTAATYWDRSKFTNRTLFAPYAYKTQKNSRKFKLEDVARINKTGEDYTELPYFKLLKQRWAANFDSLEKYYMKMRIRHNETGEHSQKYEHYPNFYHAATMDHGFWTAPKFECKGYVKKWLVTYAAPFFGFDSLKVKLEFKGIVAVSMNMLGLDINQCPDDYYVPNAFKNTHKCDEKSSYCVPIQGREYELGGYKCECLQGYEYPYEDPITYFDGQLVEAEFLNIVNDEKSRYDTFKCRLAGAAALRVEFTILSVVLLLSWMLFRRWTR